MRTLALILLSFPAYAQLTSVSPSSHAFEMVADTASGPYGPVANGVSVTLSGTGTVTWDGGTCFGGYASTVPSKSGTLPMTVIFYYGGYQSGTCTITFTGGSGGTGTLALSISKIPNARRTISTDMLGNLLSDLGYCSNPSPSNPYGQSYRIHRACTLQEGTNIRPGGTRTATAQGASYIDATYGALVVNQGSGFTRSYVVGNQISYNRDYVVLWNGTNAVLHKIDAADNSQDMLVSGPGAVCSVGSSSNIGLGTTAATAQMGFCLSHNAGSQTDIKKFSWSGTTITDLGVLHRHPAAMTAGLWGTGQAAADGWLSHFDDSNNLCVMNWFEASPTDTCIAGLYTIRNATLAPYPSRSTGLHYIFAGSDTPNKTTAYVFNPVTKSLMISGQDVPIIDSPSGDNANAKWGNGACVVGVDCAVGGHHNTTWFAGEPWDCGTGRGRVQQPNYADGGACVRGYGWNTTTGHDLYAKGGPVYPALSPLEEYFVGSRAPVQLTSGGYGGQGLIPAWRISSCTKTTNVVCTLAGSGSLSASGWSGGTTPIYVDGFTGGDVAFNGRFTLISNTNTTFTYACASCSGTTASNVASVATDTSVPTQKSALDGLGGIRICRLGLGHCRTMAQPMNVSYGDGAGSFGSATGTWQGNAISAPGYQALNFPTVGQWGERACWVTDWGYLEKLYVACASTGRSDLGLPAFDLDPDTPDNCFDRYGRCIDITAVQRDRFTVSVKPTNPAFTCFVEVNTRRDFGVANLGEFTLSGPGSDRLSTPTGLASGTQYFVSAKCGPTAARVWDYGVATVRTK